MILADLLQVTPGATLRGNPQTEISGVTHDSREVRPGYLFAALPGRSVDGSMFIQAAVAAGATALLVAAPHRAPIPQIVVSDPRRALGPIAAACYGNPTAQLDVVGITGTNGKTTSVYLVEQVLKSQGARPGAMTTIEYRCGSKKWPAHHTTPEAPVIQGVARQMLDAGASHLVLEASSIGLAEHRLSGCRFRAVAFTNLTQDHLDYHQDMATYGAIKLGLFTSAIADTPEARAVVNADDPFAGEILKHLKHPVVTISTDPSSSAMLKPVTAPRIDINGIAATIRTPDGNVDLASPLLGMHNLNNLLLALGICISLGVPPKDAGRGLSGALGIPGRLERVGDGVDGTVLVDYAHTPDALKRVLTALRPLTKGRLICVFGCGGDRDPSKRPVMGRAVATGADIALVTSDNPRSEAPARIVEMILPGVLDAGLPQLSASAVKDAAKGYLVEVDRGLAIDQAIQHIARPGDTVLIAGKGHEDYQILDHKKIHFDDREQALAAIARRRGNSHG
ncbi:MAG: UDP-N-acetylmuramoyl-L-alanyl-D-glutamate--2,6-diaminopimelate ligase [Myxococcota bacterium]|nr:UDP-N-acetylmuramoyl-L-alanyl-D-glutamate--2,6-diaminopimelate ligase [Myxococcota bacterium]